MKTSTTSNPLVKGMKHGPFLFLLCACAIISLRDNAASTRAEETPMEAASKESPRKEVSPREIKINEAIDRGADYLKKQLGVLTSKSAVPGQALPPFQEGMVSFAGLTLLECGVSREDAQLKKAAEWVRARAPKFKTTYALAPAVLFLDRLGNEEDKKLIQSLAIRIVAGQTARGNWTYDCLELNADEETQLTTYLKSASASNRKGDISTLKSERLRRISLALWLHGTLPQHIPQDGDNSNTQFAILALWVARRHELPTEASLLMADQYFRREQDKDGSWGYSIENPEQRASMTCTGLLGLAIGNTLNIKDKQNGNSMKKKPTDRSVELGFQYLQRALATADTASAPLPPGRMLRVAASDDLYFLWCLERVAMIYDLPTIGDRNWYEWASDLLLKTQIPDGSWRGRFHDAASTCFALLVLKRVNIVSDVNVHQDLKIEIKKIVSLKQFQERDKGGK